MMEKQKKCFIYQYRYICVMLAEGTPLWKTTEKEKKGTEKCQTPYLDLATQEITKMVYANRHFKIEVSRQPQTSKCHVTSRLPSGLPFAVHVSTSGDLSCGK